MAHDGSTDFAKPSARQVVAYVEQMLLELAGMAADVGETALAASLALTAIQAGAAKVRPTGRT